MAPVSVRTSGDQRRAGRFLTATLQPFLYTRSLTLQLQGKQAECEQRSMHLVRSKAKQRASAFTCVVWWLAVS
jgi:hypothetical protein